MSVLCWSKICVLSRTSSFPGPPLPRTPLHPDLPGASHDSPRAQTCTFQGPGLQINHQNSTKRPPRERRKKENCGGNEKKARNCGLPTLRGPTLRGSHPSGPHRLKPPTKTLYFGQKWIGPNWIGHKRSQPRGQVTYPGNCPSFSASPFPNDGQHSLWELKKDALFFCFFITFMVTGPIFARMLDNQRLTVLGNFKDVWFYPTRFFRQFWPTPLFQLLEALFWPKKRPKC